MKRKTSGANASVTSSEDEDDGNTTSNNYRLPSSAEIKASASDNQGGRSLRE